MARAAKVVASPPAKPAKELIAHWLLTTLKITGARYTVAKVIAASCRSATEPATTGEACEVPPISLYVLRGVVLRFGAFDRTQRTLVPIVATVRSDRDRLRERLARLSEPGSEGPGDHR